MKIEVGILWYGGSRSYVGFYRGLAFRGFYRGYLGFYRAYMGLLEFCGSLQLKLFSRLGGRRVHLAVQHFNDSLP